MIYLPLFSDEQELSILKDSILIERMLNFMQDEKLNHLIINKHVLEADTLKFRKYSINDTIDEVQNAANLLRFFIAYQYYNLACQVKSKLSCRIPKDLKNT
jgi:hypothetical protein